MTEFFALKNKLDQNDYSNTTINGVNLAQWVLIYNQFLKEEDSRDIFIFPTEELAEKAYELMPSALFYPGIGSDPYSSIVPSQLNVFQRFETLNALYTKSSSSVITTYEAINLYMPSSEFFKENIQLECSDIIEPNELAKKLFEIGYKNAPSIEEPGTYTKKGEIFDIYPLGGRPLRIHYFDDMIEEIYEVDPLTLKTKREKLIESIKIPKTPLAIITSENIINLRNAIPRARPQEKEKTEFREEIFRKLSDGDLFEDYPLFIPLFFQEQSTILDFLENYKFHFFDYSTFLSHQEEFQLDLNSQYEDFAQNVLDIIRPRPESIYNFSPKDISKKVFINDLNFEYDFDQEIKNRIDLKLIDINNLLTNSFEKIAQDKLSKFNQLAELIQKHLQKDDSVFLYYRNKNSLAEIKYILETSKVSSAQLNQINFINKPLEKGFYYETEKVLILSESDFFSNKIKKTKRTKTEDSNTDLFAEQLSTLQDGDYIIHKDYGLGVYRGIQTLTLSSSESDYVVLDYTDGDKVYVPVYKLNLLQKYATNQVQVKVANLKSKKFDQEKSRVRSSVKKLAFDLLELQAKRRARKGYAFSEPDHMYTDFELSFKFEETPDQKKAIDDIIGDMTSQRPMDRLVCGDVGFGKTEVAMRAAFKAVLDQKQVGVLVPTTVLAFQHYNTFIERFKEFPVNIQFISRFKTTKEVNQILVDLAEGKIDILIGTHKLFSDNVKFKDLGLLVIDEEQRFGVGHKEKLKLLKEIVDTLTLTATPIPRTMQMSFLGIKELSLIKTAPPKRQSIKTYIIKENPQTIKAAIEKELSRGGQVFIVHNKVKDIENYSAKIRELAPTAKIVYAHGQMSEKELEKRITDFYKHKFDILISTTIIESGIDIPRANTMIIDRADTYGLSQLHQLRGRIGRSDKKAYAYFMVPAHRKLTDIAAKRLRALQTYAEIGSGFSLATSDLEIRGSGDILGAEQSGHIANIGLELYMELLQEAIAELKGEEKVATKNIEIQTPFNAYIPESYISNPGIRLKYYKKLSNCNHLEVLQEMIQEISDQYGLPPKNLQNLYTIFESRIYFGILGVQNVKVKSKTIELSFDKEKVKNNASLQEEIINFFMKRPKIYKINPDFSIICNFKDKIDQKTLLEFAKHIAEQIKTC